MVYPRGGLKVLQLQRYNMHASSVKHRYNLCFHSGRPLDHCHALLLPPFVSPRLHWHIIVV